MHTRTTWQINGVTHWATIIRDDLNGDEIRTDCGLVGNGCWESEINEVAEITCPRCRLSGGSNQAEPQTEGTTEQKSRNNNPAKASKKPSMSALFERAEVIHVYTREQAIRDSVLIDVTIPARDAGFRFPVAVTSAVWQQYVRRPAGLSAQDETGHLWDILWMLRYAIRQTRDRGDIIHFTVHVQNDQQGPRPVPLKAVCGPDDHGKPCLTIMMPNED